MLKALRHMIHRPAPSEVSLPPAVRAALAEVFGTGAAQVRVVAHARNWLLWHPRVSATTRRGRILLRGAAEDFLADPALVLEEYFHVLRQWQPGRLTRLRYVLQWLRHGYTGNAFEVEAKRFAGEHAAGYAACCARFSAGRDGR